MVILLLKKVVLGSCSAAVQGSLCPANYAFRAFLTNLAGSKLVLADFCICYQGGYIKHSRANWEWGKVVFLALNKYDKTYI